MAIGQSSDVDCELNEVSGQESSCEGIENGKGGAPDGYGYGASETTDDMCSKDRFLSTFIGSDRVLEPGGLCSDYATHPCATLGAYNAPKCNENIEIDLFDYGDTFSTCPAGSKISIRLSEVCPRTWCEAASPMPAFKEAVVVNLTCNYSVGMGLDTKNKSHINSVSACIDSIFYTPYLDNATIAYQSAAPAVVDASECLAKNGDKIEWRYIASEKQLLAGRANSWVLHPSVAAVFNTKLYREIFQFSAEDGNLRVRVTFGSDYSVRTWWLRVTIQSAG